MWYFPEIIASYDKCFKDALEAITNISFSDYIWNLCCLPVLDGGIGVRKVKDICLPSFLSSINSTLPLINYVLSSDLDDMEVSFYRRMEG